MTTKTKNLSGTYLPVQGIMVYRMNHTENWSTREYYLESHDLAIDQFGNTTFLEGRPLRQDTLVALGKSLSTENTEQLKFRGILPENLLYFNQYVGSTTLIWFVPSRKYNFYFSNDLHLPDGIAHSPSLVFMVRNNQLSVFATKSKKKPTMDTKLFRAPFHNVNDQGNVCLGSGKRDKKKHQYFDEEMASWERVFWGTVFTATHGTPVKGNLNMLWKQLIETGDKFPNDRLIASKFKTIEILTKKL